MLSSDAQLPHCRGASESHMHDTGTQKVHPVSCRCHCDVTVADPCCAPGTVVPSNHAFCVQHHPEQFAWQSVQMQLCREAGPLLPVLRDI